MRSPTFYIRTNGHTSNDDGYIKILSDHSFQFVTRHGTQEFSWHHCGVDMMQRGYWTQVREADAVAMVRKNMSVLCGGVQ